MLAFYYEIRKRVNLHYMGIGFMTRRNCFVMKNGI